jgi:branched-chain amino acid transport system ATP-binding protein
MDAKVKNISHGHQQWLEICLALATEPELLLLDEPTTGMTPEETSRTAEFVKALNTVNMSILVVEHDMSFVRQIGSKITVLHQGRLFAEGSLKEIESNQDVRRIYLGD